MLPPSQRTLPPSQRTLPPESSHAAAESFPNTNALWLQVLRMYLAAFSVSMLRELWEHALTLGVGTITMQHYVSKGQEVGLIAPETEKVIKVFVAENPFAYHEMNASFFIG
jgi:hypothetical protein